jgi:hypothetical protein
VRDAPAHRAAAAFLVAIGAFALYRSTLLPGFDLGDTASFQTAAGSVVITPRDAYPLYFAVSRALVWLLDGDAAHAMNVASALAAAVACGLIVLVAAELAGSTLAGVAAALLFAGSYTFWSQAIIAEVYALHILLIAATLLFLMRWSIRPTSGRLAVFFGAYALSFGNHLSMILLAPAYAGFLVGVGGWRFALSPRTIAVATGLAAAGALQYTWNFRGLWLSATPPDDLIHALEMFWFDVTKADWRETMILQIPVPSMGERLRMYAFDLRQQFGVMGAALAAVGIVQMARHAPLRAALVAGSFLLTWLFAFGYNVGDPHVFFLPSHLMIALATAPAVALVQRALRQDAVALLIIAAAVGRIHANYPAMDRSDDLRPLRALEMVTYGLDDRNAVLITDLNWQLQNGLAYFGSRVRPEIAHTRMSDILLYLPALVRDNVAIGREIVLAGNARQQLHAAYGPLFRTVRDSRVPVAGMDRLTADLPPGTRYVLCVLQPTRELAIDPGDLRRVIGRLTGGPSPAAHTGAYLAIAGLVGEPPALMRASDRPFRAHVDLAGLPVDIRMESWLAFDTIRRMGFGHVVAARRHALIVERGVSFVALDSDGQAVRTGYHANIFAPPERYLIR